MPLGLRNSYFDLSPEDRLQKTLAPSLCGRMAKVSECAHGAAAS